MVNDKLWQSLIRMQIDRPVNEERAIERLGQGKVNLFTPWGPPYGNRGLDLSHGPELSTIKRLVQISQLFEQSGQEIGRWVFLGADDYGTVVNSVGGKSRVNPETARRYFAQLGPLIERNLVNSQFLLWSGIKEYQRKCYQELERELTDEFVLELVGLDLFKEACGAARRINSFRRREESEASALIYLRERLIEAEMIEENGHPIKISLAPPHKDRVVDGPLPILYLVPMELRTPWLK